MTNDILEDDEGVPLWILDPGDRRAFDSLDKFVTNLIYRDRHPRELCAIALALSYLRRIPQQTANGCNLEIGYRYGSEYRWASLEGYSTDFCLTEGGSFDSGCGHDTETETKYYRHACGDGEGTDVDVFRWVAFADELLSFGGSISSEDHTLEDIQWDDGDSDRYWKVLEK